MTAHTPTAHSQPGQILDLFAGAGWEEPLRTLGMSCSGPQLALVPLILIGPRQYRRQVAERCEFDQAGAFLWRWATRAIDPDRP
jgi:hypothetical protein